MGANSTPFGLTISNRVMVIGTSASFLMRNCTGTQPSQSLKPLSYKVRTSMCGGVKRRSCHCQTKANIPGMATTIGHTNDHAMLPTRSQSTPSIQSMIPPQCFGQNSIMAGLFFQSSMGAAA